ncbi:MAG: lamin tail domain-containing protein [Candidatus Woesearchaeota archaeon]
MKNIFLVLTILFSVIFVSVFSVYNVNATLVFTEIMYNPFGNEANREWIELFNYGNETLNISNWKLQDGTTIRNINLYNGSYLIEPYSFVILARNPENFSKEYNYSGNLFQSSFTLTNTGKELILYDNNNNIVDSVFYANLAEEGYTLELKDINLDNYLIENWQQSNFLGNPGKLPFEIIAISNTNQENNSEEKILNESNQQDNNQNNQEDIQETYNQVPEFTTYGIILALTFVIAMFFKNR